MNRASNPERVHMISRLIIAAIIVYVILDIVAQALPPHYSPIRQAESDLAVGPYGFIMRVNFLLRGLLSLALVQALRNALHPIRARWGLSLFGIWGAASFLLAFFNTDILDDPHLVPHPHLTWPGELHLGLALIGFIVAPIGAILLARAFQHSDLWRPAARLSMLLALIDLAALLALKPFASHHEGGLGERIFLAVTLLWTGHTAMWLGRVDPRRQSMCWSVTGRRSEESRE